MWSNLADHIEKFNTLSVLHLVGEVRFTEISSRSLFLREDRLFNMAPKFNMAAKTKKRYRKFNFQPIFKLKYLWTSPH